MAQDALSLAAGCAGGRGLGLRLAGLVAQISGFGARDQAGERRIFERAFVVPLLADGDAFVGQFCAGGERVEPRTHGGRGGGIRIDVIEARDFGNFAGGLDRKFHGTALEAIVLIFQRVGCGIVGVAFGGGAGFFVGDAEADGAEIAVGAGLSVENVQAKLQIGNLLQLRGGFGIHDRSGGVAGGGCASFDLVAK